MRPLDSLHSIKLKLGIVIVAAVGVTVVVVLAGEEAGLSPWLTGIGAAALALALVQLLAHGMTYPLREMVVAARAMAKGDYRRQVTASSRDEVGELARAFNRMAAELEEVDRFRRDLVANVSHELRTPLGALRAKLENLIDDVERRDEAALEGMLAQVGRLTGLVDQLLELSKLESGVVPLDRRTLSAASLVERVASECQLEAASRNVRVDVAIEPQDMLLRADDARIHQVLTNLVTNAIRHSPEGGVVAVSARAVPGAFALEVADEGPGIPPGEAERVFERFYRSDQARTGDGGSGLGLAIARWIVELHDGTIRAEERQPQGCRMIVELPA